MGRKGSAKQKTKSNPISSGIGKGSTSSVMKVFDKIPVGTGSDTPKTDAAPKKKVRRDSDRPQKGRNG